jgi:thioredoxin reductase
MDVLFVGAGPAGLAGAIELARLVKRDQEAGGGLGDVQIGSWKKPAAWASTISRAPWSTRERCGSSSPA